MGGIVGGMNMVFKRKGKKGRRRWGMKARRGARRALTMGPRLFGFEKGGFKVSKAVMAGSALATLIVPGITISGTKYSAVDAIMNKNNIAPTMTNKLNIALFSMASTGLGVALPVGGLSSSYQTTDTKGICGMGVVAGAAMGMAGKFVNPWLRGSAVKL